MDERVGANGNSSKRTLPSWMLPGQKPEMHIVNDKVEKKKSNKSGTRNKRRDVDHDGEEEDEDRKPTTSRPPRTRASRKSSKRKLSGYDEEDEDQESSRLEYDGKLTKSRLPKSRASGKISKRKSNGGDDEEEGPSRLELSVRPKEKKMRKKRSDDDDDDDDVDFDGDGEISEIPREKRERGGRSRAARKATRAPIDTDDQGACHTDGDDDLTVEDLVSIAEEYVNGDKEEQGSSSSSSHDDLTSEDLRSTAKEYVTEDTDVKGKCMSNIGKVDKPKGQDVSVPVTDKDNKKSWQLEETPPECPSKEKVASEVAVEKPAMSGDPAKDMLNLFLGPLLTTPKHKEKKPDLIAQDFSFAYETQKQKQAVAPVADAVPLTKKKTSLKDKVAMFLD